MASAKYVKAMATGVVKIQKAPRVSGETMLVFKPLLNKKTGKVETPKSISIGLKVVEPLKRSDVTIDHLKHSNLQDLVRRQAIKLLDV
jgi:hypothetical protein